MESRMYFVFLLIGRKKKQLRPAVVLLHPIRAIENVFVTTFCEIAAIAHANIVSSSTSNLIKERKKGGRPLPSSFTRNGSDNLISFCVHQHLCTQPQLHKSLEYVYVYLTTLDRLSLNLDPPRYVCLSFVVSPFSPFISYIFPPSTEFIFVLAIQALRQCLR